MTHSHASLLFRRHGIQAARSPPATTSNSAAEQTPPLLLHHLHRLRQSSQLRSESKRPEQIKTRDSGRGPELGGQSNNSQATESEGRRGASDRTQKRDPDVMDEIWQELQEKGRGTNETCASRRGGQ
ncbi:hypothetical protein AX14_009588 [Amanita brunnescens Koide BX004]|jgi:hypothetical protein|nr:hypothetical protein AX14_009588 [Amanita brunnescens Koide BX004]